MRILTTVSNALLAFRRVLAILASVGLLALSWSTAHAATPEQMAKDPNFKKFLTVNQKFVQEHARKFGTIVANSSDKELQQQLQEIDTIFEQGKVNHKTLQVWVEKTGIKRKAMQQVGEVNGTLLNEYDELKGKGGLDFLNAAMPSGGSPVAYRFCLFCIEYELRPIDPDYERDPCLGACYDTFVDENERISAEWLIGIAACTVGQVVPGVGTVVSFACYLEEYIRLGIKAAVINAEYDRCRERCFEAEQTGGEVIECSSHNDCDQGQYCYLFDGPLNNPIPEPYCRPLRSLKANCKFDYECESGCCKYYFFWDAFKDVCRPASKC